MGPICRRGKASISDTIAWICPVSETVRAIQMTTASRLVRFSANDCNAAERCGLGHESGENAGDFRNRESVHVDGMEHACILFIEPTAH